MQREYAERFELLRQQAWDVLLGEYLAMPVAIKSRYPWIPFDLEVTLCELEKAVAPDEQTWLLTSLDYSGQSDAAFAWDEWEAQSIEAADGDEEWITSIRSFWNDHCPICLSVKGGYSYFAIVADGSIVHGREPEFEDATTVASSYLEFLEFIDR